MPEIEKDKGSEQAALMKRPRFVWKLQAGNLPNAISAI